MCVSSLSRSLSLSLFSLCSLRVCACAFVCLHNFFGFSSIHTHTHFPPSTHQSMLMCPSLCRAYVPCTSVEFAILLPVTAALKNRSLCNLRLGSLVEVLLPSCPPRKSSHLTSQLLENRGSCRRWNAYGRQGCRSAQQLPPRRVAAKTTDLAPGALAYPLLAVALLHTIKLIQRPVALSVS